jgi:hypothetical protein
MRDDPSGDETSRHVGERAHAGLAFFVGCVIVSTGFEIARFPERAPWMLSFALAFVALGAVCLAFIGRNPTRSVPTLIAFVNVIGAALNAYHALVGAPVAMCLWTLTGLLGSTAVFLRWGAVDQVARVHRRGALLSGPSRGRERRSAHVGGRRHVSSRHGVDERVRLGTLRALPPIGWTARAHALGARGRAAELLRPGPRGHGDRPSRRHVQRGQPRAL